MPELLRSLADLTQHPEQPLSHAQGMRPAADYMRQAADSIDIAVVMSVTTSPPSKLTRRTVALLMAIGAVTLVVIGVVIGWAIAR